MSRPALPYVPSVGVVKQDVLNHCAGTFGPLLGSHARFGRSDALEGLATGSPLPALSVVRLTVKGEPLSSVQIPPTCQPPNAVCFQPSEFFRNGSSYRKLVTNRCLLSKSDIPFSAAMFAGSCGKLEPALFEPGFDALSRAFE